MNCMKPDTIGTRLKWARSTAIKRKGQARRVTQEELAKVMGLSREAVSLIESGKVKNTNQGNLIEAARYLKVDVDWLIHGGEMTEPTRGSTQAAGLTAGQSVDWKDCVPAIQALASQLIQSHKDNLPVSTLLSLLIAQCKRLIDCTHQQNHKE